MVAKIIVGILSGVSIPYITDMLNPIYSRDFENLLNRWDLTIPYGSIDPLLKNAAFYGL